ncbi:hypothetical protein ACFE04_003499 [Oxalis oulophora]
MTSSSFVVLVLAIVFFTSSSLALNVNKILSNYSDYGVFNHLLDATGLSGTINSQQTITILALDNGACGGLNGRPIAESKRILMNHVILDYYDVSKLNELKAKRSTLLTTLYQASGFAKNNEGFVNVTVMQWEDIMFGSGVPNSPLESKFLGPVMAKPFSISILHVSQPVLNQVTLSPTQQPTNNPMFPSSSPTADSPPMLSNSGNAPSDSNKPTADSPDGDKAKAPTPSSTSMVAVGSGVGFAMVIGLVMNIIG